MSVEPQQAGPCSRHQSRASARPRWVLMTFTARASARPAAERVTSLLTRAKLPLGRGPSGSLLCWCKEVTKKHLESRASLGGPARGFCDGMKAPYTTRPLQADKVFASLVTKYLHAKRVALPIGVTELDWNMHPLAELREGPPVGCSA